MKFFAIFALALAAFGAVSTNPPAAAPAPIVTVAPEEDEPGWDCQIHGNLACSAEELATQSVTGWEPYEDEPGFNCRIHGNLACSAEELAAQR